MNVMLKRTLLYNLKYIGAVCFMMTAALYYSCTDSQITRMEGIEVVHETKTQIDSIYKGVSLSDTKNLIANSNHFLYELYKLEITDSLLQYSATAPSGQVLTDVHYWMGEYLLTQERYHEALSATETALKIALQNGNESKVNDAHSLMSVIYFRLGLLDDAISHLKTCLDTDSRNGDNEAMSSDLNNMAAMSLQAKQYENAKGYIDQAMLIERPLQRPSVLAIRLGIASEIYAMLELLPQAEAFAREAYDIDRSDGRDCKAAIRLSQLANVLIKQNRRVEALEALNAALPILKQCGNNYSYIITECQLGDIHLTQGDSKLAAENYHAALTFAQKGNMMYLQQRALLGLWKSLKASDIVEAATYIEQYAAVTDSIFSEKTSSMLAELQTKFERKQHELETEQLKYQMKTRKMFSYGITIIAFLIISWLLYIIYSNRKTNAKIRNLEQIRSSFFTNITHEFRTPLNAIIGLTRDISNNKFDNQADSEKAIEIINRQSQELLCHVNQLLDISKVKSQVGNPDWQHGDIVSYTKMILQNFRSLALDKQIELTFSCSQTSIMMDFVPNYVHKIIGNLLSNAIKFTPIDGHVLVEVLMKGNSLQFKVSDDGKGIEKSRLPNIFDPYYSGTGNEPDTSTGIGLSLVNEMVKALHGTIDVSSILGKGTIFTVSLPITHTAKEITNNQKEVNISVVPTESNQSVEKKKSSKTVLIVEDNNDLAFYIGSHLSKDFAFYYAQNGKEGLDKAINIVPDIIITDIMMPVMDGTDMIIQIRKNPLVNHIPVIAVTAKVNDSDRIEGLKAGFDAYLTKPFNGEELTILVDKLLEQRDLLHKKYTEPLRNGQPQIVEGVEDTLLLGKLVDFIYHQLDKGKSVNIETCADYMRYSSRQLSRKILAITGETLNKYINRIRVEYAKKVMNENPTLSLLDISVRCGAESSDYFARQFRQYVGMTPTQYLKSLRTPSAK